MALTEEQRNPWRAIVSGGDYNLSSQDWEDLLTELDSLYTEAPIAQPASVPSEKKLECPYPCGWENLYSLIVSNGALIVRSIDPDSVSESTWAAISNTIEHAKDLCKHGMLPSAAPQPDCKAQLKDLREQVECSTITRDNMEGRLNIATVKLAAMKQQRDALLEALEDKADIASIALRKAWQLGQTYWQQADSGFESQHKKSEVTQARFQELVDETRSAIASVKGGA